MYAYRLYGSLPGFVFDFLIILLTTIDLLVSRILLIN